MFMCICASVRPLNRSHVYLSVFQMYAPCAQGCGVNSGDAGVCGGGGGGRGGFGMLAIMVMVLGVVLTIVCMKVGIPIFARTTTAVTIMMGPTVLMMMRIAAAVVATMLIIAVGINDGDCDDRGVRCE